MKDNLLRMRTAMAAIVIACLLLAPAATAMPVPSQAPQTALPNPYSGGGGSSENIMVLGAGMVVVSLAGMGLAALIWIDGNDDNNDIGAVWFNSGVLVGITGCVLFVVGLNGAT